MCGLVTAVYGIIFLNRLHRSMQRADVSNRRPDRPSSDSSGARSRWHGRGHTEDRIHWRDAREVGERRIRVHGQVCTYTWRSPKVGFPDRRALGDGHLLDVAVRLIAASDDHPAIGCSDVTHPLRLFAQHGHDVLTVKEHCSG
jgi:hypothetical protein